MEKAKQIFSEYIKGKKLRFTKQRKDILEVFLLMERHFTVEDLYKAVKKVNPDVGFATIYRTLRLIYECGLSNELKLDGNKTHFEQTFGNAHHDHLICTKCSTIIEVQSKKIEELQNKLAKEKDFVPQRHKLEIYGLCSKCK